MNKISDRSYVHPSALVEEGVTIAHDTKIWHHSHIRKNAHIGERCNIGKGVFIDFGVIIGDDCKLQNYACVYHGVTLGRGVFVGPHVVFTNDKRPRATDAAFSPLGNDDWVVGETRIQDGASIGANSTILPDITVGKWSLVAAGSTVTRDVEAYSLVIGSPARHVAWVCPCGARVESSGCETCGTLPQDHPLFALRS